MALSNAYRAAALSCAGLFIALPTVANAFVFTTPYSYYYARGTSVTTGANGIDVRNDDSHRHRIDIEWDLTPGNYSFDFSKSGTGLTYFFYNAGSGAQQLWDSGNVRFTVNGAGSFGMIADVDPGLSVSIGNGAPEIDGGKLPLAALLLGLVAVIAQRKRMAALAA